MPASFGNWQDVVLAVAVAVVVAVVVVVVAVVVVAVGMKTSWKTWKSVIETCQYHLIIGKMLLLGLLLLWW